MLPEFKFHHVGVATFDLDTTARFYTEAGYSKTENIVDPLQNIRICFLEKEGMPRIELLSPVDETSPVNRTLQTSGVSPYHFCYIVDNLETAIKQLRKKRFLKVSEPKEACALRGRRVCFLFNKDLGLIELLEENKK